MTKLCPEVKPQQKKFKGISQSMHTRTHMLVKFVGGKIKDPSGVKRKDFRGSKA